MHGKRFVYKFVCNLVSLLGYTAGELHHKVVDTANRRNSTIMSDNGLMNASNVETSAVAETVDIYWWYLVNHGPHYAEHGPDLLPHAGPDSPVHWPRTSIDLCPSSSIPGIPRSTSSIHPSWYSQSCTNIYSYIISFPAKI